MITQQALHLTQKFLHGLKTFSRQFTEKIGNCKIHDVGNANAKQSTVWKMLALLMKVSCPKTWMVRHGTIRERHILVSLALTLCC